MSPDVNAPRDALLGWGSLAAAAAHLAAGATHHDAAGSHRLVILLVGVIQLLLGGRLLQRPTTTAAHATTLVAVGSAAAFLVELVIGGHRLDAAGAVTLVIGAAFAVAQLARHLRWDVAVVGAVTLTLAAGALGPAAVRAAAAADNHPAGCSTPNRRMTLYAEELPREDGRIRLGWGRSPGTASIPGPLIEMVEGDCLAITVVNDVPLETLQELQAEHRGEGPLGVSLHVHGVKYRAASDGTAHHGSLVPPGRSRTFVWYAQPRSVAAGRVTSNGTAGTWWYHDHVVGTAHGTGGIAAGLVGGLVVRRPSDPKPDRTFTVAMGPANELNYRTEGEFCSRAPDEPASDGCIKATEGERIEFVVFNVGDFPHVFHLHGHNWADNRTGIPDVATDTALIDARTIGPSESFGFQVVAGESVGHGAWMLHCHMQSHSDGGMATTFDVRSRAGDPAGALPVHDH